MCKCVLGLYPLLGLFPLSVCTILVIYYSICFNVYFIECKYCYPRFLLFLLHEIPFSIPLLLVCVYLMVLDGWQHIYEFCFPIHSYSPTLCLLVRAFKPFTFKLIIDRYVCSAILLIDCFPLFFFFLFFFFFFSYFVVFFKIFIAIQLQLYAFSPHPSTPPQPNPPPSPTSPLILSMCPL